MRFLPLDFEPDCFRPGGMRKQMEMVTWEVVAGSNNSEIKISPKSGGAAKMHDVSGAVKIGVRLRRSDIKCDLTCYGRNDRHINC